MSRKIEVTQNLDGTWRVSNVPLISTGIEYPLASGPTTFTEAELADAVTALADPAIVEPRIKLGHASGYNEELVGDAEQAFGRIDASTVEIGDNGQTIYGDYTGLPGWLASVMGMAYPNRSIEGNFDVETVTGKHYKLVITAVSLLGVFWPGCQVLEDLPTWYGDQLPDGVQFSDEMEAQLKAGGDVPQIKADADTSRIRRQFYDRAQEGELADGFDTWWWWIRGERIADDGGLYLIAEDDQEGDLYKVPVEVGGEDITFGAPEKVVIEYKTASARAAVVAGMRIADSKIRVHASRADTGGPTNTTRKGASTMDESTRKALAAALSLPENATPDQIRAATEEQTRQGVEGGEPDTAGLRGDEVTPEQQPPAHQTPPGTSPGGTTAENTDEAAAAEVARSTQNQPDAQAGKGDTVTLDRETYERLNRGAQAGLDLQAGVVRDRQTGKVEAAIKAGKIPPARKDHYAKLMAADEEGTTQLLNSLTASAVPLKLVGELGGNGETIEAGAAEGLPDSWFPEGVAARTAFAAGVTPVVTKAKEG